MLNRVLIWVHSQWDTQISSIGNRLYIAGYGSTNLGFSLIGDYKTTKYNGYTNSFCNNNFGLHDSMCLSCLGTNNSLPSLIGYENELLTCTEIGIVG